MRWKPLIKRRFQSILCPVRRRWTGPQRHAAPTGETPRPMSRSPFLTILLLVLGALAVGLLVLGAFPPEVPPQPVERPVPNERFSTGR
jgi:hypothetical protein